MLHAAETSQLLEVRNEASNFVGREITDQEWSEAYPQAKRKLDYIINHEGDANGTRRQPWYLGKLIEEAIAANALTHFCLKRCAEIEAEKRKAASEENGQSITPTVYQEDYTEVNLGRRKKQ